MAYNMTQQQLEQLIWALRPVAPMTEAGVVAIVRRLVPFDLGRDKLKR